MRIDTERLGVDPQTGRAVWVLWCSAPLGDALAAAADGGATCPECGDPVDLARARGVLVNVAQTPNCISVSDRCPSPTCQAQLHWDATPVTRRADLRWTKVAVGAEG